MNTVKFEVVTELMYDLPSLSVVVRERLEKLKSALPDYTQVVITFEQSEYQNIKNRVTAVITLF